MNDNSQLANKSRGTTSVASYIIGFLLAVILTLSAYWLVINQILTGMSLTLAIMGLALTQVLVQLFFFLHFGSKQEADSRWHQAAFYFMLIVLVVIVGGSLWIMAHLNYNMMMTPEQMDEYMLRQGSKGF